MRTLFVVPARSGSKRLPGKNKRMFNRVPLVSYSIDFAQQVSNPGDIICVTSDDSDILEIAESLNVDVIVDRPKNLAEDDSKTYDVLRHVLEYVDYKGRKLECLVLLQPTTPFRRIEDFKEMMNIFLINKTHSVISVSGMKKEGHSCGEKSIDLNGSIYIYSIKRILRNASLNLDGSIYYEMTEKYSIDIDTMTDWKHAEEMI